MASRRLFSRRAWIAAAAALVLALAVLAALLLRPRMEPLTVERLNAAKQRWQARRPADYDMQIVVSGIQKGVHAIKVRDGDVVDMTTGGAEVPKHVWPRWTVEGLFDFLETELENARDPANTYGVADPNQVVLQADFDEPTGYPRRFLRHVMGRQASVEWEVTEFRPALSD
jgi:hypothetical protein